MHWISNYSHCIKFFVFTKIYTFWLFSFECLPSLKKIASMGLDLAMYCIVSCPKYVKITTKDIVIYIIPGINLLNVFNSTSYGVIVNISNLSNMIIARLWFIPLRRGVYKQDVRKEGNCIWSCQQWFIIYRKSFYKGFNPLFKHQMM